MSGEGEQERRPLEPRILVGTLHCGERDFERCLESLERQSYRRWEHLILRDLPNKLAHDRLYREFMNRASEFDLFLKLDADMVFRRDDALARVVELFRVRPALDHLESLVYDWYSDSLTKGLHVFSNRAVWRCSEDTLFVDPPPAVPGTRLLLRDAPAPLVVHCPDPSPEDALCFGVHRALKAVQLERKIFRYERGVTQWKILARTWAHFRRDGDRRLGLAVWAADAVAHRRPGQSFLHSKGENLARLMAEVRPLDAAALRRELAPRWQGPGLLARYRLWAAGRCLRALPHRALRRLPEGLRGRVEPAGGAD